MPEMPVRSQTIRDLLDDLPIGPASLHWFEHLIKSLDAPLGVRESALLFQARTGGQYHVGKPAGIAEEDILRDEKFEFEESTCAWLWWRRIMATNSLLMWRGRW